LPSRVFSDAADVRLGERQRERRLAPRQRFTAVGRSLCDALRDALHLQRLVGRVHELRRHLPRRLREVELGARQVGLEARALRLRRVDFNQPPLAVGKRARLHIAQRVAEAPQRNRLSNTRLAQRELVRPQGCPHGRVGQQVVEVECPTLAHARGR
jgi:hypothetical protein